MTIAGDIDAASLKSSGRLNLNSFNTFTILSLCFSGVKVEGHEARCWRAIAYLVIVAVSCYNIGDNWFYQNDVNKNTCAKKSQIL